MLADAMVGTKTYKKCTAGQRKAYLRLVDAVLAALSPRQTQTRSGGARRLRRCSRMESRPGELNYKLFDDLYDAFHFFEDDRERCYPAGEGTIIDLLCLAKAFLWSVQKLCVRE